jgi:hypothetical protein
MINGEISIGMAAFLIIIVGLLFRQTGNHADKKHEEANYVREMYKKNGAMEVWTEKQTKNTQHFIISLDDGRYGDWVVLVFDNEDIVEKSVFIPKDGNYEPLGKWLKSKAIRIR